ncbi:MULTISPECIES: hypothetical protein [unclassified Cyanobium]|uniref:hypothetical protein n=1 Tax=unclassified Cyanobium TaxID=2627006 RepID=UPI0020CBCFD9|nr:MULTISPECIES: hypothetical protein [unclassified Cyanobium]MCP9834891.1 hypothetical protein [Cyanobium sp. La Preciosa 7G6]MCP9937654.1 hypothetical protein [Cyanobium sp. Aljojuca 7A6]
MDPAGGEPMLRVPLRLLRELALPYPAYHQLIAALRAEAGVAADDPLLAELTEASATALRQALEQRQLEAALAAHDDLLDHLIELAAVRPQVAAVLWQRYGDLLGQLTGQVHERLVPRDGAPVDFSLAERAGDGALCLRMAAILEPTAAQPWAVPDWLPVLEQQLVQHGALAWQQRVPVEAAAAGPCLDLFLRLGQLLDPVPAWVELACRAAMGQVIEAVPPAGALEESELALLVARVGRLPVAAEQRAAFDAALLRARFSLELLQQGRGTVGRPAAEGLEVLEAEWLEEDDEAPAPSLPAVEWRPGALVVELDALELQLLRHAEGPPESLEEALAELRRRHHDSDFWGAAAGEPDPLELLRRFELEAGFYATTQAPLESLRQWARPALQALLQAQVWSGDGATLELWEPWGQAGQRRQPPRGSELLERLGGGEVLLVGETPEASEVLLAAHRAGRLFAGGAFGLRCLAVPESRHPQRPAAGFEYSLEALVAAVEALYQERPFTVLLAGGGAYRLPLAQTIGSRYGVLAVAGATSLAAWLGGEAVPELGR